MSAARLPLAVEAMDPGPINPGFLAMTEDFSSNLVVFGAGDVKQLLVRNPRRTGATFMVDPSMVSGLGILPRFILPAEVNILGRQTGVILLTMDLYRVALMSEWWGYAIQAGTVTVIEYFKT